MKILEEYYGTKLWDVRSLLSRMLRRERTDIWHRITGQSWMGTGRFLGFVGPSVSSHLPGTNSGQSDAELTPKGIEEAHKANTAWRVGIEAGMPLPQSRYSSPLRYRSLSGHSTFEWGGN